jgi:hypothetical protein
MGLPRSSHPGRYMQILICSNAAAAPRYAVGARSSEQDPWPPPSHVVPASQRPPNAPVTGEATIEQEALTDDVQDEKDPDGYGFGV